MFFVVVVVLVLVLVLVCYYSRIPEMSNLLCHEFVGWQYSGSGVSFQWGPSCCVIPWQKVEGGRTRGPNVHFFNSASLFPQHGFLSLNMITSWQSYLLIRHKGREVSAWIFRGAKIQPVAKGWILILSEDLMKGSGFFYMVWGRATGLNSPGGMTWTKPRNWPARKSCQWFKIWESKKLLLSVHHLPLSAQRAKRLMSKISCLMAVLAKRDQLSIVHCPHSHLPFRCMQISEI